MFPIVLPEALEAATPSVGGEAMDVVGLLGRIVPDAIMLVERVLQHAQEQLTDGSPGGDGSPDEVVVAALGNRLAQMFSDDGSGVGEWPGTGTNADDLSHYEELVDRNSVLAAALGACDCWGHHQSCPFCDGIGGPGWTVPDERLFASYVRPALAVRNISAATLSPNSETQSRRKEGRDVQHFTRARHTGHPHGRQR
jgi:hypothetical protein